MNLEKLFKMVFENLDNVKISYSNINGDEKLVVNDVDITDDILEKESFDDSEILEEVAEYKEVLEMLDDCVFMKGVETIRENCDMLEVSRLMDKEHFTKEEANQVKEYMDYTSSIFKKVISNKIQELQEISEKL